MKSDFKNIISLDWNRFISLFLLSMLLISTVGCKKELITSSPANSDLQYSPFDFNVLKLFNWNETDMGVLGVDKNDQWTLSKVRGASTEKIHTLNLGKYAQLYFTNFKGIDLSQVVQGADGNLMVMGIVRDSLSISSADLLFYQIDANGTVFKTKAFSIVDKSGIGGYPGYFHEILSACSDNNGGVFLSVAFTNWGANTLYKIVHYSSAGEIKVITVPYSDLNVVAVVDDVLITSEYYWYTTELTLRAFPVSGLFNLQLIPKWVKNLFIKMEPGYDAQGNLVYFYDSYNFLYNISANHNGVKVLYMMPNGKDNRTSKGLVDLSLDLTTGNEQRNDTILFSNICTDLTAGVYKVLYEPDGFFICFSTKQEGLVTMYFTNEHQIKKSDRIFSGGSQIELSGAAKSGQTLAIMGSATIAETRDRQQFFHFIKY